MDNSSHPFPLPDALPRDLAAVYATWRSLRRGGNEMPFSDDLDPAALSKEAGQVLLLDVFDKPERFRFTHLAGGLLLAQETALSGRFIDEVELADPLAFLRAQASTTVEARAPTYDRHATGAARLLLPMWGDGRVSLLLGAVQAR
jgi:hypothetical protein